MSHEDDDDDDDEEEEEDEGEEEDGDESDDTKLPATRNHYLNLRQRELGIFHRPRERATCRAFHTNTIASRNLVQRMKVSHTLDAHNGCVNALAFNRIGRRMNGTNEFEHRLRQVPCWPVHRTIFKSSSGTGQPIKSLLPTKANITAMFFRFVFFSPVD